VANAGSAVSSLRRCGDIIDRSASGGRNRHESTIFAHDHAINRRFLRLHP
jgi:hypothetical protein